MLRTKRVYEPAVREDGLRVLVDRIWPRGLRKADANLDLWLKDLAPSMPVRKRFGHDPDRWDEFLAAYHDELDDKGRDIRELRERSAEGTVTLLYAARDTEHNNAVALKQYLEAGTG